eukprot:TRINITY_DN14766_c0_g1_i1.p1 TRINITY_DN14766_c0_g1~~TRINITY_DN14766_c0_g1_i1.p1  ORF type:complete len:299 (+),score=40.37 TRINITY_DN14766_c0_g1_i1:65-898(+)
MPKLIRMGLLEDEAWEEIVRDELRTYYITPCWQVQFYAALCYKGFVTIAQEPEVLIPELQASYAVLDYENLHVERSVLKRIKKGNFALYANSRQDEVFRNILRHHSEQGSWLGIKYWNMFREASDGLSIGMAAEHGGSFFQPQTFELIDSSTGVLVSGEIGYICGSVYTSLTGFFHPSYPSSGKIQLCTMVKYLQSKGVVFINLGHPPCGDSLKYKAEIGAVTIPRVAFLEKWEAARNGRIDLPKNEMVCTAKEMLLAPARKRDAACVPSNPKKVKL